MRKFRHAVPPIALAAMGGTVLALLAGCTAGAIGTQAASSSGGQDVTLAANGTDDVKYFYGTQQEWIDQLISCFQGEGISAERGDSNDYPQMVADTSSVSQEVYEAVNAKCNAEVGQLYYPPSTEESERAQYQWFAGQYDCLVAAGFQATTLPSEDSFLDQWRSQGVTLYDPMSDVPRQQWAAALAACPRTTETWPSQ